MRKTLTLIALLLMASLSTFAQIAAVPQRMNFQGRLARPDGTPVANGTYSVTFSLYDALTTGARKLVGVLVRQREVRGEFARLR